MYLLAPSLELTQIELYAKIGKELFCREFNVEYFWSDDFFYINASIQRKTRKTGFWGNGVVLIQGTVTNNRAKGNFGWILFTFTTQILPLFPVL